MSTFLLDPDLAAGLRSAVVAGQQIWITTIEGDRSEIACTKRPGQCGRLAYCYGEVPCMDRSPIAPFVPPERFRVLDTACPECDGDWRHGHYLVGTEPTYHWEPCTACWRGREVHEFRTTCPTCKALGCTCPGYCERSDDHQCLTCGGAGSVLVVRAICHTIPVVAEGHPPTDVRRFIVVDAQGVWLVNRDAPSGQQATLLTLDVRPRPGVDFGVLFVWEGIAQ